MEDRKIKELGFVGLLIALFFLVLLGDKVLSKANQKPEPLDSGTIYEMQEIPAHTELPSYHYGYLVYDDAYIISYQKTVDGKLKQDQWYVDKDTYEKYRVGDWFNYIEEQEHCSSDCSWTRIEGRSYNDDALRAALISSSVAASLALSSQSSSGY